MRKLYKLIKEGEDRAAYIFGYKRHISAAYFNDIPKGVKRWQSLYTFSFFPTRNFGMIFYLNLLPARTIPLLGIRFAHIKHDYYDSAESSVGNNRK